MNDFFQHESAEVSAEAFIGVGTKIWHNAQIREHAKIGDNCHIGKGVYIDAGVQIGNGVKIQNGISIYRGITIEDLVLLGPNCTFTNDPYPRAFPADWEVVPTYLRKGCSIGANATIVCGVTLGSYSLIGAGAVVTKDTLPFSMMVGNPARLRTFVCICGRELDVIRNEGFELDMHCAKCARSNSLTFTITSSQNDDPLHSQP